MQTDVEIHKGTAGRIEDLRQPAVEVHRFDATVEHKLEQAYGHAAAIHRNFRIAAVEALGGICCVTMSGSMNSPDNPLIAAARAVRERAHAPFSHFKVGCAIEDEHGQIYTGCNVENATYGLTVCAERVAVFKAISEGAGQLKRVAVVADTPSPTPPCGACRQILWEFCGDAELILANLNGARETLSLKTIFPRPFDASFL